MKREQHLKVALKAFSIRLRAGLRIKGLKDTTHGSSGETFLCSLPSSNLTNPIIFGNPEVLVNTYTLDKKIFYHEDKLSTWFPKVISGTSSYYQMAPTIDNPFAKWLREYSKVPNTELPAFGEDVERLFVGGKVDVKMGNIIIEIDKKKFISADKYLSEVTATLVNTSSKPLSDSINHLSQIDPGYSKYVNNIQLDVTLEGQIVSLF
ncbi:hypothetical protein C9374_000908 [Naegleria lovaniensis]|uniref:Uncharacterized protein n=1 Tax=Naegleria lovaniensis TaxID=51637 RepID=A0AA88KMY7_NAELO|nr:uncharacterized protein C9374_000908 [Naegleria lovaniensis]KAG2388058.1 hypothetical protein C9374_000908 [Naegleria lovaniensis]